MFDYLVFIGRFQPFHNGHQAVINRALREAKRVIVLVGSAGSPRTVRNPFTFDERKYMIERTFSQDTRLIIKPLYDMTYNDTAWNAQVQNIVNSVIFETNWTNLEELNIGLIGASKDHTSYYLNMFKHWGSVNVPLSDDVLHATDIRNDYLLGNLDKNTTLIPEKVKDFLFTYDNGAFEITGFQDTAMYDHLRDELLFAQAYKNSWRNAPFPVKHQTVDAVVVQSGHILLVQRKHLPGKGLWALPGGHLDEHEKLADGVIRELKEETRLKVPEIVLRKSVVAEKMFDDPQRSNIGRVITYAQYIKLNDAETLPKIKAQSDAKKAEWIPLGKVKEELLFDDHFHIINHFTGIGYAATH